MPDNKNVGLKLREARQRKSLTQQELADKVGITRQAICNYETGDARPSDEIKLKICEVLGENLIELFFLGNMSTKN